MPTVPASLYSINRLSDPTLQLQIDQAIATLPPDKSGAVIVHGNASGINVSVVGKIGDHWTVDAGASYRLSDQSFSGEVAVSYSW